MTEEIVEKYWSRFQDSYDKNQEYVVGQELLEQVKEKIQNLGDLGETLELGCGTGYFSEIIAQKASHFYATDLSDELLHVAQKRLSNNTDIIVQKEDCMNVSFPPDKFNSVFMANLIHVIENPLEVLQESNRILKDNGILIITSFTNHGMKPLEIIKLGIRFMKVWGKPPKHTHRFSPESLRSLLNSAGFLIEESCLVGNKTKSLFIVGRKLVNA